MNDDFEKYLEHFAPVEPSVEFRQKSLAASRRAWKTSRASSSVFSLIFSPRSLLWTQAAMAAAALALVCVENTMTNKLLAKAHPAENGTEKNIMEMCREFGLDETYCRAVASARKLYAANNTKPVDFSAHQKTMKTIMEEQQF